MSMMKIVLIPLALLVFVFVYPFAEYNIDCPTGIDNPKGNEDCTWTKMIFWEAVATLSLTEYGFPPDQIFFEQQHNPDSWESQSIVPMLAATIGTVIAVKVREYRRRNKSQKMEEWR